MLFMVIERFHAGNADPAGERFARQGRMLPEGVLYRASWMEPDGTRCFQLMEAPDARSLDAWIARWSDLVEFEIAPVLESSEFWGARGRGK